MKYVDSMVTLAETFNLLVNGIAEKRTKDLIAICRDRMTPQPYSPSDLGTGVPAYDQGYSFFFHTDNGAGASLIVLLLGDRILQAGVTIRYRRLPFPLDLISRRGKHLRRIQRLAEDRYGPGRPFSFSKTFSFNFEDNATVFHVLISRKPDANTLVFRVGDRELWSSPAVDQSGSREPFEQR